MESLKPIMDCFRQFPATNTIFFFVATALAVLFSTLFYLIIFKNMIFSVHRSTKNMKKLYHPVVGTKLNQLLHFNRLHDYATDLACKYKTFRFPSVFRSEIYTSDPANVEYILKTNFQNYGKGRYNYSILNDLMGDGIFAVDGDKWRHQRKLGSSEFSTKAQKDFSSEILQTNGAKLAQIISENATSNLSMDFQDLFMKSTMDSIVKVVFGIELDSMRGSSEEGTSFANAFDDSNRLTMWRYVDISWKIKRFLNIGSEAKLKKTIKVIDAFVYKEIRNKATTTTNDQEISSTSQADQMMTQQDILSRFLYSNVTTDHKYLRDILLNIVVAAKDSTTATLSWFFYMLCKHPNVQEKVAKEIREATNIKDNMTFKEFAATVTDDAINKMQYLHAAITETLRLYPALPVDAKICFSDDTLPDGFSVRKGDMVSYYPYVMGRMKFIWGDDAEDFHPERWLNEHGKFQSESPFKFTAFQAGPRICFGKEYAYRQMKIFSAILLAFFKFKLSDETKVVNYKITLSLQIDNGLHLSAFHRFPHKIMVDA